MVEEIATVVSCEAEGLWLSTQPVTSCNACQVSDDCGTGIVTKALTPRQHRFFISTDLKLLPGEQVRIGISETGLVQAALMVYLLPLVLMLLGALAVQWLWQPPEGLLMLAAGAGALVGFALARRFGHLNAEQICIIDVLPSVAITPLPAR